MEDKPLTQAWFPSNPEILEILQHIVSNSRAMGVVVGLLDVDGSQRVITHGEPGPGCLPLDRESVFEIGSLTKVFTGTLLAEMVRSGEVELTTSISKLLPPEVIVPTRNGKAITLLDIATHHSGLPVMPSNFAHLNPDNPFADYTVEQMYAFLSGMNYFVIRVRGLSTPIRFHLLDPAVPLEQPHVGPVIASVYRTVGMAVALERYESLRREQQVRFQFNADELTEVGYWLVGQEKIADAIKVLEFNVEMYPDAPSAYAGLGEGYRSGGRLEEAHNTYGRAVELAERSGDPGLSGFHETLASIAEQIDKPGAGAV